MRSFIKKASETIAVSFDWTKEMEAIPDVPNESACSVTNVTDETGSAPDLLSPITVPDLWVFPNGEIRCWLSGGVAGTVYYVKGEIVGTTPLGLAGPYRNADILRIEVRAP